MVLWIQDIHEETPENIGWKAKNLAKVSETGLKVPKGFIVPAEIFKKFQEQERIRNRIKNEQSRLKTFEDCERASETIQRLISEKEISDELLEEFKDAYSEINVDRKVRKAGKKAVSLVGGQRASETVVIRVSPSEKEKDIFPPEIGVQSKKALQESIKTVWKRYFSPEAIYYRSQKNINSSETGLIVQKAVESEVSGSVFTRSPSDRELIEMESCYGLGTGIKNGETVPDRFMVERNTGRILEKDIVQKRYQITKNPATGKIGQQPVPSEKRNKKSLSNEKFSEIVNNSLKIEKNIGVPVRVDFSIERNQIFITGIDTVEISNKESEENEKAIINGIPVGEGTVEGTADIIYTPKQGNSNITVFKNASKEFFKTAVTSKAVITDMGARSAYLPTLCRSMDLKGVFRTKEATDKLTQGQKIIINCDNGAVLKEQDYKESSKNHEELHTITGSEINTAESLSPPSSNHQGYIRLRGEYFPLINNPEEEGFIHAERATQILNTANRQGILFNISSLERELNTNGIKKILSIADQKAEMKAAIIEKPPKNHVLDILIEKGVEHFIAGEDISKSQLNRKVAEAEKRFMLKKLRETDR